MSNIKPIKIDRYETRIVNGRIEYFAIAGKKEYPMPDCYKDMYNDRYLAIAKKTMEMPELFDTESEHYMPLRTAKS